MKETKAKIRLKQKKEASELKIRENKHSVVVVVFWLPNPKELRKREKDRLIRNSISKLPCCSNANI